MRENEALEHHALLVMSVIDEAICHIDEVDRVIELCTRVGATHSRFTGFTSDLFWVSCELECSEGSGWKEVVVFLVVYSLPSLFFGSFHFEGMHR